MRNFLALAILILLTFTSGAQADEITDKAFTISFKNNTSIPFSFTYESADSHCWKKDGFSSVVVLAGATSSKITTEAEVGQGLFGTCTGSVPHLGISVVGTVDTGSSSPSGICKFKYDGDTLPDPELTGSCTLKNSDTKYLVTVSGQSSDTVFTVKKE